MPEGFPRVHVGDVELHVAGHERGRVRDGVRVVRPRAGVDQHGIDGIAVRLMDAFAHRALEVRLEALDFDTEFQAERLQP
mgnify:CR=1 FL=1